GLRGPGLLVGRGVARVAAFGDGGAERVEVGLGERVEGGDAGAFERGGEDRPDAPDLREVVGGRGRLRGGLRGLLLGLRLPGGLAAASAAAAAGPLASAAGAVGLHVVVVDELDDGHLGGIALAEAELDDARVAA